MLQLSVVYMCHYVLRLLRLLLPAEKIKIIITVIRMENDLLIDDYRGP